MAVTWAVTGNVTPGVSSSGKLTKRAVLTPTGTYTTGGDAISPSILGLKAITNLFQTGGGGIADPGVSQRLAGTAEAPLIQLFETNNTEVGSGVSITGRSFLAVIEGY